MLWNSCPSTTSPTFSFLLTPNCISPLTNSSLRQTGTGTFPHSSPMPHSLRQNPVLLLDEFPCFAFLVLIHSAPPPVLRSAGFHFISHMLSLLDSAAALHITPQHHSILLILSHFSFLIFHWTASSQSLSLLLGDSVFPLYHGLPMLPCTVYKPLSPISCSLASSMQFSLVSSLPRLALKPLLSEAFPQPEQLSQDIVTLHEILPRILYSTQVTIRQKITHSHSLHVEDYLKDTLNMEPTGDYFQDTPSIDIRLATRP